jgi:hypothetical protein
MRRFLILLVLATLVTFFYLTLVKSSYALTVTCTITADNHYALYIGDSNGDVTFIGRNEIGGWGSNGGYNFSYPEIFTFDLNYGDYVYVAGWSDDEVASGLLAQCVDANNDILFTTSSAWQVVGTGQDLDDGDDAPTPATMQQVIQTANNSNSWYGVVSDLTNEYWPWGTIPGIIPSANWIWKDWYSPWAVQEPGEFLVFRFNPLPVIEITIDIKPGSCPNPLNVKSKGVLPVAVLGSEDFDVSTIDPASIRLSREGVEGEIPPLRWSYKDIGTPFEGELCDCHALNGDGYIDLSLKFDIQELITTLELGEVIGNTLPLTLTGNLKEEFGGTRIKGEDCVRVLENGE